MKGALMPDRKLFVIGASAGGVEALRDLTSRIPEDFAAPIIIVQHTPEQGSGMLADLLARRAKIPVVVASEKLAVRPGVVYVAPPGKHTVLEDGRLRLLFGPSENRNRPAIDPLFRSAARHYGRDAVGVVLTGYLDDGTAGMVAIQEAGGITIVQEPADAAVPWMPRSVIETITPDYRLPLSDIPETMVALARNGTGASGVSMLEGRKKPSVKESKRRRKATTTQSKGPLSDELHHGDQQVSVFTCPECHGTLWELDEGGLLQFKCRVGHKYSADSMYQDHTYSVERALWASVRVLQEHADLSMRLADRARKRGHQLAARQFTTRFEESTRNAEVMRDLLMHASEDDGQRPHPIETEIVEKETSTN
jgi:two-component system, chemotaxis family, protein-glutamate methylesterase/glutaminase